MENVIQFLVSNYKYLAYVGIFFILAIVGYFIDKIRQDNLRKEIMKEQASVRAGHIETINPDGTLSNDETLNSLKSQNIGKVGIASEISKNNPGTMSSNNTNANLATASVSTAEPNANTSIPKTNPNVKQM